MNKDFDVVLEALYVKNDQTTARYAPLWLLQNGNDPSNIIVEDGGLVRSITYGSVTTLAENQQQTNLTKNYRWSIGGKYKLPNNWKLGLNLVMLLMKEIQNVLDIMPITLIRQPIVL